MSTIPPDEGQEDFMTEPLAGLEEKPAHEMSESDWREYVNEVHALRQSYQTFKAKVQEIAETKSPKAKREKAESKQKLSKMLEEF